MMQQPLDPICIIGSGVAGVTAALELRKRSDHSIVIVSSESPDYFSRPALMYVFMGHMRWSDIVIHRNQFFIQKGIEFIHDALISVDFDMHQITLKSNKTLRYNSLIIATGSHPKSLSWVPSFSTNIGSFYDQYDLQYLLNNSHKIKNAVIIGGGLIGVEMAEMLRSKGSKVTIIIREKSYWSSVLCDEESEMIHKYIENECGVKIYRECEIAKANLDGDLNVYELEDKFGRKHPCDYVGITVGVIPNVHIFLNTALKIKRGILVDEYFKTNIENVYAIGDCAELNFPSQGRKQIEAVWYVARKMGEHLAVNLSSNPKPYQQDLWYNSAKFFHVLYHVYGSVPPIISSPLDTLVWQDQQNKKSLRIVFEKYSLKLVGIQSLGISLKQDRCEYWIRHEVNWTNVVAQIESAFFEQEFVNLHAAQIKNFFLQHKHSMQ